MRRLVFLALLAHVALAAPAAAHSTADPAAGAGCLEPDDAATLTAASSSGDGGVTAGPSGTGGDSAGGIPATWDGGADSTVGDASAPGGDVPDASSAEPGATVAQEPEPEPEGPGEEQPGEEGEEPPPIVTPEVPNGEAPAGEAPAGGLPRTGVEVLQLALLGVVLLLVGARLRVLALRRRRRGAEPDWEKPEPVYAGEDYAEPGPAFAEPAPAFAEPAPAVAERARPGDRAERDEWAFPDPHEPAPTGLLPSTATARRQARAMAMAGDPD